MKMDDATTSIGLIKLPSFKEMKQSTQGETYKYLNSLIKGKSIADFENVQELISLNTQLSHFEDSLRLVLIDSLHIESHVIKILLSQNDYHIKRILKCKWFFKNKMPVNFYMTQIFPYISVSLRYKLINKLSRYLEGEKEAEKLFEFIVHNYSNEMAEPLLAKCSAEFILKCKSQSHSCLNSNGNGRLIYNITQRLPEVGVKILSSPSCLNSRHNHQLEKAYFYLALNRPDLFIPFYEKHHLEVGCLRLGKSLTKKYKGKILEIYLKANELTFVSSFKEKHLFQRLTAEDKIKFLVAFVLHEQGKLTLLKWISLDHRVASFLKLITPKDRLAIVESVFEQVYHLNFKDHPKCWTGVVLELLPSKERQFFIKTLEELMDIGNTEIAFSSSEADLLYCLYEFEIAFPKFKEMLSTAALVSRRMSILDSMVKNCGINKDLKGLEKLVEFVSTRHRHDDPGIIHDFLHRILNAFPTPNLSLSILEKLLELSYFHALKGNYLGYTKILALYIFYRLKNGMTINAYVGKFFEFGLLRPGYNCNFLLEVRNFPKESKTLFFAVCKEIMQWVDAHPSEDHTIFVLLCDILMAYEEYNRHNRRHPIFLNEIPGVEKMLKNNIKIYGEVGGENWPLYMWEKFGTQLMQSYSINPGPLIHILKRNSEIIEKNMEKIVIFFTSSYWRELNLFFALLRKFSSFLGIEDKMSQVLLNEFKNGKSTVTQKQALELYSSICTVEDFCKVIKDYIPKDEKIQGESDPKFNEIQLAIPQFIKNISPRWKNLDLILKFLVGDFLQNAVPSFYSCCYHAREDVIVPFLREYLGKLPNRISYKKAFIKLIAQLSDRRGKMNFCVMCWADKDPTIRRLLFSYLSKGFLEMPTRESFECLEKCILDCDKIEILESRPQVRDFPSEFLSGYILALWRFSEKLKPGEKKNFLNSTLSSLNAEIIKSLPPEFCEDVIRHNLFKSSALSVNYFTVNFLASDSSAVCLRLEFILDLLKNSDPDVGCVTGFLSILRSYSLNSPNEMGEVLTTVLKKWEGYPFDFLHEERFKCIYFEIYTRMLKKFQDSDLASIEFGKELRKFLLELEGLSEMIVIIVDTLENALSSFKSCKKPINEIMALKELSREPNDRRLAIIAILVLSGDILALHSQEETFDSSDMKKKKELEELVDIFRSYGDNVVDIYLRRKFGFKKCQNKELKPAVG